MKFSKALLLDGDIGTKLFSNSVSKSKDLLNDIFGLCFAGDDPNIHKIVLDDSKRIFLVKFSLGDRIITAELCYKVFQGDMLQEVLIIKENATIIHALSDLPNDFGQAISKVMDILEFEYDLEFTPLDPNDVDSNIKDVTIQQCTESENLKIVFTHEEHEAIFTAKFLFSEDSKLTVLQAKKHLIFLE